ncbi:MAG TPA: ATP-binding protein [Stellaceae bacterium]|nr:ATP-binding protein [Stellaceae bacterium]
MRSRIWLLDTIGRRFTVTIILAIFVAFGLVGLFNTFFGGVWAQPPLEDTGLLNEAADIIHMIEVAPPELRQTLAEAVETKPIRVDWYPASSSVSLELEGAAKLDQRPNPLRILLGDPQRVMVAFKLDNSPVTPSLILHGDVSEHPQAYFAGVKLGDDSWLVLTALSRNWGLSRPVRLGIRMILLILLIAAVSAIATRQLSRPIKELADAVRHFGINPQAPALPERGPREIRGVITAFNAMQAQIQKFVGYRMAMLAAISHDLRTPLTRIRLRGEFIENEEQRAKLFRDVDEMQAMVHGALAFFRDDADEEATTIFDLTGLLRTIANDYADQGIEIGYTGPSRVVYLGRPFALKRAFTNLIENAIKYGTPPEIELSSQDKTLAVAIRDHGPGIPPDALDRVFAPFYRLERSRNRATGGVGLGLSAAQAIIRGHGGEITLGNRSGGGLEARVTLPLLTQQRPQHRETVPGEGVSPV